MSYANSNRGTHTSMAPEDARGLFLARLLIGEGVISSFAAVVGVFLIIFKCKLDGLLYDAIAVVCLSLFGYHATTKRNNTLLLVFICLWGFAGLVGLSTIIHGIYTVSVIAKMTPSADCGDADSSIDVYLETNNSGACISPSVKTATIVGGIVSIIFFVLLETVGCVIMYYSVGYRRELDNMPSERSDNSDNNNVPMGRVNRRQQRRRQGFSSSDDDDMAPGRRQRAKRLSSSDENNVAPPPKPTYVPPQGTTSTEGDSAGPAPREAKLPTYEELGGGGGGGAKSKKKRRNSSESSDF